MTDAIRPDYIFSTAILAGAISGGMYLLVISVVNKDVLLIKFKDRPFKIAVCAMLASICLTMVSIALRLNVIIGLLTVNK